jgi:hypothetical protein
MFVKFVFAILNTANLETMTSKELHLVREYINEHLNGKTSQVVNLLESAQVMIMTGTEHCKSLRTVQLIKDLGYLKQAFANVVPIVEPTKETWNDERRKELDNYMAAWYGNNSATIAMHMDAIIFMLFFLQDDAFPASEVQQSSYTLKSLRDIFAGPKG